MALSSGLQLPINLPLFESPCSDLGPETPTASICSYQLSPSSSSFASQPTIVLGTSEGNLWIYHPSAPTPSKVQAPSSNAPSRSSTPHGDRRHGPSPSMSSSMTSKHPLLPSSTLTSGSPTPSNSVLHRSKIPSVSVVSHLGPKSPVLSPGDETVAERKEDLREILAGKHPNTSSSSISTVLGGFSGTRRSSEDEIGSSSRPSNMRRTSTPSLSSRSVKTLDPARPTLASDPSFKPLATSPLSSSALLNYANRATTGVQGIPSPRSLTSEISPSLEGVPFQSTRLDGVHENIEGGEVRKRGPFRKIILGGKAVERMISGLEVWKDRGWIICLQAGGQLSIISLTDDVCLFTALVPPPPSVLTSSQVEYSFEGFLPPLTKFSTSSTSPSTTLSFTISAGASSNNFSSENPCSGFDMASEDTPREHFTGIFTLQSYVREDTPGLSTPEIILSLSTPWQTLAGSPINCISSQCSPYSFSPPSPSERCEMTISPGTVSVYPYHLQIQSSASALGLETRPSSPTPSTSSAHRTAGFNHPASASKLSNLFRSKLRDSSGREKDHVGTGSDGLGGLGKTVGWEWGKERKTRWEKPTGFERAIFAWSKDMLVRVTGNTVELYALPDSSTGEDSSVALLTSLKLEVEEDLWVTPMEDILVCGTSTEIGVYKLISSNMNGAKQPAEPHSKTIYRLDKIHSIPMTDEPPFHIRFFPEKGLVLLLSMKLDGLHMASWTSTTPGEVKDLGVLPGLYVLGPPQGRRSVLDVSKNGELDVWMGHGTGQVTRQDVFDVSPTKNDEVEQKAGLGGGLTCLKVIEDLGLVVGGADDGSVGVWDSKSCTLRKSWILFTCEVIQLVYLNDERAGKLQGCVLCVAKDGTVGVIDVEGLSFLYIIPGSFSVITKVAFGEGQNILLVYAQGIARIWDGNTLELLRSVDEAQAIKMTSEGGWYEVSLDKSLSYTKDIRTLTPLSVDPSTIILDIPTLITTWTQRLDRNRSKTAESSATILSQDRLEETVSNRVTKLGGLLSIFLTWGLDPEVDDCCESRLRLRRPEPDDLDWPKVGLQGASQSFTIFEESAESADVWKISSIYTGRRLLTIVSILQLYVSLESFESAANEITTFYTMRLQEAVGEGYQRATLDFYVQYWLHPIVEIQQAAKLLFASLLARTVDESIVEIAESWRHKLPVHQTTSDHDKPIAAQALVLIGHISVENHSLLAPQFLKEISNSIVLYLNDEHSPYRQIAIELCSSGFQVWQHYVDSMEILRSLFRLSIRKSSPSTSTLTSSTSSAQFLSQLARTATLQIASTNTPLFMTTVSYDILNAESPDQRNASMKLVAVLAKKRPLVLFGGLGKIVEAVVKSLDPNLSTMRDAVQQTATVILDSLVNTFPSISFHGQSQKLAVGTLEGATVVYDLKTATRLYVLDNHNHNITALSFSPDGRRLVTVSLEESKVSVWKVGISFSSMFKVGVPPKQGGDVPGGPYKTYNFNIGDEGNMTTAASLEWVRFEWPGERSARLRIRETALTFAT
ncbi:FOG: WD40 repeat [Phaffia rhodozyma]|uniref:FOG: WD40 repeat n=1 Tax=Phaffia rhodozyma TaxID=264483 RepID=A0A0F7SP28_PHARH|nr:FOG: WD40 repeat [Phaffia rhodozyma]